MDLRFFYAIISAGFAWVAFFIYYNIKKRTKINKNFIYKIKRAAILS